MCLQDGFAGTNWRVNLRIASGVCSPAALERVYVRSNPFGPATRISQLSLSRDPAMDTRHSPFLSLNACSTLATISWQSWASPRFSSSTVTPIAVQLYRTETARLQCKAVKPRTSGLAGTRAHREQSYSQLMLKTSTKNNRRRISIRERPETQHSILRRAQEIKSQATRLRAVLGHGYSRMRLCKAKERDESSSGG